MRSETRTDLIRFRPFARYLLAPFLAIAVSLPAAADTVSVSQRDALKVIEYAVSYRLQKTELRKTIDSACYFDPEVDNSLRCSWAASGAGADPYRIEQTVKRRARKRCKAAGGGDCVLFWRNGALRFKGLIPIQAERLESALLKMTTYDAEGLPLPEGGIVSFGFLSRFEKVRDDLERYRRKYRGRNPHYAVCTNERGPWTSMVMQGPRIHISHVRTACVWKCKVFSEFLSREGECHVVLEDGKFASPAAELAITQ